MLRLHRFEVEYKFADGGKGSDENGRKTGIFFVYRLSKAATLSTIIPTFDLIREKNDVRRKVNKPR